MESPRTVSPAPESVAPTGVSPLVLNETGKQVVVVDTHGRVHPFPPTEIQYSPAVCGVLIEENRALLCTEPTTGLYTFPGGRVQGGQTVEQAVRHYFRADTGITPLVQTLLMVEEQLRLDEETGPWQLSMMYYQLARPPVGHMGLIDFENAAKPDWVPLKNLTRQQMQFGYDALRLATSRL